MNMLCIVYMVWTVPEKCKAGEFYSLTSHTCTACGKGYFQPDSGRTYCLPCAIGKTTSTIATKIEVECFGELRSSDLSHLDEVVYFVMFRYLIKC